MRKLSVNIDHIATLRQARKEPVPDPVHAAFLVELGGADGITVHLRTDRRHINERDLELLRKTIKTELNLEMAATKEMLEIAQRVKPDVVTLVPERPDELTTEGGLDVVKNYQRIKPIAEQVKKAGIRLSFFIETDIKQVQTVKSLYADQIEINTNQYTKDIKNQSKIIKKIEKTARYAHQKGLLVHCGHGIDYWNIQPILQISEVSGFSIGFSIIARAVMIGLKQAVQDMKNIIRESNITEEK
ncbi:MAG: pyridoxine 5'-phosphate synthase [Candidatus Latescibacteria bacterium]|nr:pyridoxine 5'-phosphate synthase [Candidatus Latescibacterota bacterium]